MMMGVFYQGFVYRFDSFVVIKIRRDCTTSLLSSLLIQLEIIRNIFDQQGYLFVLCSKSWKEFTCENVSVSCKWSFPVLHQPLTG